MTSREFIVNETNRLLQNSRKKYGNIPPVKVKYYNRGNCFGQMQIRGGNYFIHFSEEILNYSQKEIKEIIAHEVAHVICFYTSRNHKHDHQWKKICKELGGTGESTPRKSKPLTPKRLHKYYKYRLDSGIEVWLSSLRHKRIQEGFYYVLPDSKEIIKEKHFLNIIGTRLDIDNK